MLLVLGALVLAASFAVLDWPWRGRRGRGRKAKATITRVRRLQGDFAARPVVELDLEVERRRGPPLPVTVKVIAQRYVRLEPGRTLPVRLDPADPSTVEIDWARA